MEQMKHSSQNGRHSTTSHKKTSNVSYRSSQPASKKQVASSKGSNPSAKKQVTSPKGTTVKKVTTHNKTTGTGIGTTPGRTNPERSNLSRTNPGAGNRRHTGAAQPASYRPLPKKKKRSGCGCFPLVLTFFLLVLVVFVRIRFVARAAFQKIDKYSLDYSQIVVNENDDNIDDYENIALFGVDDQDNEIHDIGSRTDCIMIASINKRNKKVKLLSIYRDTYVSIDGKYDKINAAYSYGGPELALSTINRNLDLNITNFATVNFKALADAVDTLGGISLTVQSEKELENLNDYIHNMNNINGGDSPKFDKPDEFPFTATFDGNQAVAYSRIRYMAGGDHARANHQRLVVEGIMNTVKKKPWKLKTLVDVVLPQCKTSLSTSDMTRLSMSLLRYKLTDSEAYPFDSEDERYNGIYYGFPLTTYSNVIKAHEYLFGTKDYLPTEELGRISEKINVITQDIGLN